MYLLRFLTAVAVFQLAFAGTGQGIEPHAVEKPSSQEVAESVKQEVFLKTANTEPIEIDRLRRFDSTTSSSNQPVHSLHRAPELDEGTPAPRVGYGATKHQDAGIGKGISVGHSGIGSGTSYGTHNSGRTKPHDHGIGSGTSHSSHESGIGHGIKVGGKPPAIGSGVADEIEEVGIGHGVRTTARYPTIGSGVSDDLRIGKGTFDDTKGDRVILDSDKDGIDTALGDEVKIGRGAVVIRAKRNSQFDRFDTGFAKECNSYYGRVICYRVYTNPNIVTPSEYTCWRIANDRKNCTEVDNIVYLKSQGFRPDEYEIPSPSRQHPRPRHQEDERDSSSHSRQHPRPRHQNDNDDDDREISSNSRQHPRPRHQEDEVVLRGQDRQYDPYNPAPRRQGSTHRFVTSSVKLGQDSIDGDDNRELYREKRKRAVKTEKPYYIPPDYENDDDYINLLNKVRGPKPSKAPPQ